LETVIPRAVASRAKAIPLLTSAMSETPFSAIVEKEFIIPRTVPRSPNRGEAVMTNIKIPFPLSVFEA